MRGAVDAVSLRAPMLSPLFLHAVAPFAVLASQAGGGGSFGGGRGGGGHGDGGGLPIELVFWLLRLAFAYPVIGIPLLIGVVVVFSMGAKRGWWRHQENVIQRARPARAAYAQAQRTAALKREDPAFDENAFLARVDAAFRKAQSAWCAQELEPLRPFVSDGVFERFSLQIAEQRAAGWRQGMDGLVVERPFVQSFEAGRRFDTLTLRIGFTADIHRVDLASGKRISGSELPRDHFEECWSFVRRRGAKTKTAAGLIEGQCPNCGAPLAINQSAKCASCQALVRSGEFDWVLAEITQASEWTAEDEAAVAGLAQYAQRDPGVSSQLLEDRVSVAFWRWSDAARLRSAEPLARVATEDFCAQETQRFAAAISSGSRVYLGDRAVGSVRTRGLLAGAERDRVVVEVVWDGRFARADRDGEVQFDERRSLRRTLFVLERRAGATSDASEAFASARCPNCGAHDAGGTDPRCPYCSAPRTGGRMQWLVADIVEQGDAKYGALLRECDVVRARSTAAPTVAPAAKLVDAHPTAPAAGGLLSWAIAAARADGEFDVRERQAIEALADKLGAPRERLDLLLSTRPEELAAPKPANRDEARAWLERLCELALADGTVPRSEQALLRDAAKAFGLSQEELADAFDGARQRLYRESKQARAAERR
jgi:tellurite resistance protein